MAEFLVKDLGLGEAEVTGDPAIVSQVTPTAALDKAAERFGTRCFAMLPHVDSSKGAWKELEGVARAQLFTHPLVVAAQIINPDSRRRLQDAFNNSEYKRDTPLRLVQASDCHGSPSSQPGSQHTVFETAAKLSFSTVRDHLLRNRPLRISAESIDDALSRFSSLRRILSFDIQNQFVLSPELRKEMLRALCSSLNTRAVALRINFFNLPDEPSKTAERIKELVKELRDDLDPTDFFPYRLLDFSYSQARQRFVIEIRDSQRIRLYEGIAYVADDGDTRPAQAWEIERQVSRNFYSRYGRIKQQALVKASTSLLMISNSLPAFSIASRVDQLLQRGLPKGVTLQFERPGYDVQLEPDQSAVNVNGVVDGDYYLLNQDLTLKGGRLEQEAYYRFSLPSFPDEGAKAEKVKTIEGRENCVIISPGGGVNFVDKRKKVYAPFPLFFLTPKESESEDAADIMLSRIPKVLVRPLVHYHDLRIRRFIRRTNALQGQPAYPETGGQIERPSDIRPEHIISRGSDPTTGQ